MSCDTCNTCTSTFSPRPCPDPLMTCPLVVPWDGIDVTLQCCEWHEQYLVSAEPNQDVVVVSTDNSVDIDYDPDTKTYDLSWCCEDKFVSVDATDTPAFLEDQIISSVDWAILIENVAHPTDWTRVLRPRLNQAAINFPWTAQFKVSCARDYIVNMFQDSSTIDFVDMWCKYEARIKDCQFIKPSAKVYLSADKVIQAPAWQDAMSINTWIFFNWFYDIDPSLWFVVWLAYNQMIVGNALKIPQTWYRRVSLKWSYDYNRWVNAARFLVERFTLAWSQVLIDCKKGREDWYWLADLASWDGITWINPVEQLWQWDFSASEIFLLDATDELYALGRIDTAVVNWGWVWSDWLIIIRQAGISSWGLGWWTTLNPEAWFSMSIERVSQTNWDSRYNLTC